MHTIENTLFIGKVFLHFPSLPSTNAYAVELISKNKPSEGTVIAAARQQDGRGQMGSSWHSEAGKNITLSIILYPGFLVPRQQFLLGQAICLSMLDVISPYVQGGLSIKWPNDLYIGAEKLGGLLIQNNLSKQLIQHSVAGIGLNINQTRFPAQLPNPTSLALQTGKAYPLEPLIAVLCQAVERRYLQLRQGKYAEIRQAYVHQLYRFGEEHLFERPDGNIFSGTIVGVTESGKLRVQHRQGEEAFGIKEIHFVR